MQHAQGEVNVNRQRVDTMGRRAAAMLSSFHRMSRGGLTGPKPKDYRRREKEGEREGKRKEKSISPISTIKPGTEDFNH